MAEKVKEGNQESEINIAQVAVGYVSNCDNEDPNYIESACAAARERLAAGFDASGAPGGNYSEHNPPPGMVFSGYLKGNTGIVWKTAESSSAVDPASGHCPRCGFSLYYYSDQPCLRGGDRHPKWKGNAPPPSFSNENP
mmetsp:Transcript_16695/g.25094  ORF Transcript_16695/g.25094 Transcript_16695/m.25094 type:complete len:139 (+) Transcript_16695:28-444(+)